MGLNGFKDYKSSVESDYKKSIDEAIVLNEGFSINQLRKVGDLMAKLASKKLGSKFTFLWNDKFKKANGQKGTGALYLSNDGKMLRFNYVKNVDTAFTINSVDYWVDKKIGDPTTTSVTFNKDTNIVDISKKLFATLKAGKMLKEDLEVEFELTEAQEAELNEITDAQKRELKRQEFAKMAGIPMSYANTQSSMKAKTDKMGITDQYEAFMKVESNVAEKTQNISEFKDDENQLGPSGIYADPKYVFKDIEVAAGIIADGYWRSLIIAGEPGIGKTHGVKQVLNKKVGAMQEGPLGKWVYYNGLRTTAAGLYKTILLNKDKIIVFDDSDSIWASTDTTNLLKITTSDDPDPRILSQNTNAFANVALMSKVEREEYIEAYIQDVMDDPNTKMKPPSSFEFTGSMINITNLKAEKIDTAIRSRSIFIDIYLAERDVLRRIATILEFKGEPTDVIKDVLDAIAENGSDALEGKGAYKGEIKYITSKEARKNKKINMRTANITLAIRKSGASGWKRMASLYA